MANREAVSGAMLVCGTLCVIAAVFCGTNLDRAYVEKSSAVAQPNAMPGPTSWAFHQSVLAPALIWSAFGIGVMLLVLGVILAVSAPEARGRPEFAVEKPAGQDADRFRRRDEP